MYGVLLENPVFQVKGGFCILKIRIMYIVFKIGIPENHLHFTGYILHFTIYNLQLFKSIAKKCTIIGIFYRDNYGNLVSTLHQKQLLVDVVLSTPEVLSTKAQEVLQLYFPVFQLVLSHNFPKVEKHLYPTILRNVLDL